MTMQDMNAEKIGLDGVAEINKLAQETVAQIKASGATPDKAVEFYLTAASDMLSQTLIYCKDEERENWLMRANVIIFRECLAFAKRLEENEKNAPKGIIIH